MPNSNDTGAQVRATDRVTDAWNKRGSWILLAGVAISMFMAGAGLQSWQNAATIKVLQDSYDAKQMDYQKRIRELNDKLLLIVPKVESAADKAKEAVDKVTTSTTTETSGNGQDNSTPSGQ